MEAAAVRGRHCPRGGSLHMAAMTVTLPPQPEPVDCSTEKPAAREDTMIGSDLIVEIPWIVFGLTLAAVCLRLRRFRRLSGRSGDRESEAPAVGGNDSTAITGEPARNDHDEAAVSAPTQPSQTRP
jgi:H+/gluconate symporter-like permease